MPARLVLVKRVEIGDDRIYTYEVHAGAGPGHSFTFERFETGPLRGFPDVTTAYRLRR
jgi:hypothetical protein